jgi:hypothetical protein
MPHAHLHLGHPNAEHIHITITHRPHPAATDFWDGNWLASDVTINAGGFHAHLQGDLRAEEFVLFKDALSTLYSTLSGAATFDTVEEWLAIQLTADHQGHITAHCTARDAPGTGNTLTFSLDLDQSFLPAILHQLDEITALFPVLGTPPA